MSLDDYVRGIIKEIDPDYDRLKETVVRATNVLKENFSGHNLDVAQVVSKFYESEMDDLIVLKNIRFESHCEHHLVPIVGVASVGYVPNGKIIGASKLARLVDCFAKRLQLQERMTMEIANTLQSILNPKGVGVYVSAEHFCISHRGVKKTDSQFITRCFCGILRENQNLRREFLDSVQN
jgi:GTP cyclohydrolase I